MPVFLQREIGKLKKMIAVLGGRVEETVEKAVRSVHERDIALAAEVIDADPAIDQMEVNIEEECLKVLALHQPVAHDLRFIIAVLKVNNDLERIGDLAAGIAEQTEHLAATGPEEPPYDLLGMAAKVRAMLRDSLDALMNKDAEIAQQVREADDEVDAMDRLMYPETCAAIREKPQKMEGLIRLLRVSQNLERIADHATNIAEDVIYLAEGEIIRHRSKPPAGA
ncbi:MAG: phosphate signaling complex protein PhoU [Candidatus Eisenbacteria bacterium]|nr:phosphate signaling complex protein PhoU [Candidatus Eisenbacteria bacterium]